MTGSRGGPAPGGHGRLWPGTSLGRGWAIGLDRRRAVGPGGGRRRQWGAGGRRGERRSHSNGRWLRDRSGRFVRCGPLARHRHQKGQAANQRGQRHRQEEKDRWAQPASAPDRGSRRPGGLRRGGNARQRREDRIQLRRDRGTAIRGRIPRIAGSGGHEARNPPLGAMVPCPYRLVGPSACHGRGGTALPALISRKTISKRYMSIVEPEAG